MNEAHDYSLCYIVTLVLKGGICLFVMWQIHLLIPRCYRFPERGLNRQNDRKKYVDICLICQEVNAFHKFEVDLSSVERGVRVDTTPDLWSRQILTNLQLWAMWQVQGFMVVVTTSTNKKEKHFFMSWSLYNSFIK